jgi:Sensory domain in DIguanylate Cyclases and Two-component system
VKNFSMFEEALKVASFSRLQDLGSIPNISRRTFDECETFLFRAPVPCLEYLSLLIENALLLRTNRAGIIYVGFEKLSRMESVIDRYLRIADLSERVSAFGEADWKPPRHPNMKLIGLPSDHRLAREWFLIAESLSFRAALIALDERETGAPVLEARSLRGFKSSDPAIVARLSGVAENLIDSSLAA